MIGGTPRVLILTASYGSGHNAVAAALAAALHGAGAQVRVVDHFHELVHPRFDRWTRHLYDVVLRKAPALWSLGYRLGDRMAPSSPLAFDLTRLGRTKLARLLDAEPPDCVACTHPTPAGALAELRARGRRVPPFAIVFSDFAAHRQWVHPAADVHYVPDPAIAHGVVAHGAAARSVVTTGIPVRSEFTDPLDRATARASLGLDREHPVVLAMAGAVGGVGRLAAVAGVLHRLPLPLHAIVVAGTDAALATRLRRTVPGIGRIRVLGYADNVRQLMAAADVLVTKAGGVSLAEALAAELPIVCFGSLPGHESRNERFVVERGAALAARSVAELEQTLRAALASPEVFARLRERSRAIRRPQAAREVAQHLLRLAVAGTPTVSAA